MPHVSKKCTPCVHNEICPFCSSIVDEYRIDTEERDKMLRKALMSEIRHFGLLRRTNLLELRCAIVGRGFFSSVWECVKRYPIFSTFIVGTVGAVVGITVAALQTKQE